MDQVEEVKQKTDIVSIINEYVPLKKAGRNFKANCPFHQEKTPSFMVSPELQIYKCFGCGETGDVFTFLEKQEGMDFAEALRFLADKVGVKITSYKQGEESEKEKLYKLNYDTNNFYQYFLLKHSVAKKALDYLKKDRGLKEETIKFFKIGFSPNVRGILKKFLVDKKKFYPKDIEKAGTVYFKGSDIVDRFRGRITFPLFDHRGNIVGFSGRILPWEGKEMAKYINSPETPIYHKSSLLFGLNFTKEAIKKMGFAIVTEGELDMISPYQFGYKNIVAIKGSALTEDQVRLLSRFTKRIVLALDSDMAGDMAARRGIVIAQKQGMEISVARFGKFKDPDEVIRADPKYFEKCIKEAIGVWDFLIDSVFEKNNMKTGEGKQKISNEVVPILISIPDKIVQAHYIEIVSQKLNIPVEAVYNQIQETEKEEKKEEQKVVILPKKTEKTRRQLVEERLLSLAFQGVPEVLLNEKILGLVQTPLPKRILEEYIDYIQEEKTFSPVRFTEKLPKELLAGYADMALKDLEGITEDPALLEKEMNLVLKELSVISIRHKLEELGVKIRELEEKKDFDKLVKFQEKFKELAEKLSKYEEDSSRGIILQET